MCGILTRGALAKQEATYYTPQRIAVGRENVARYPWAKALLDAALGGQPVRNYIGHQYVSARDYSAQSDDFMWDLQPSSSIPRVYDAELHAVCPVHGKDVRKIHAYNPWRIDPINHPYKLQCPLGNEWYPSNDYAKGDMTTGPFADDGNGFVHNGQQFYFIREYAFYVYNAVTIPGLRSLSQAYVLTGEEKYARKGAILLARLATEYPNYEERKERLFYATTGGRDPDHNWKAGGMMTDLIWETFSLEATAYAYDAFYPYLAAENSELLAFLQAKGMPVKSSRELRSYIEEKLLRVGMQALLKGHIRGNEGHHQAAAMACALVMDDFSDKHPNSKDMVDYVYHGRGHSAFMFDNAVLRDGGGHESPAYSRIKFDFIRTNLLMEELRRRHPKELPLDKYPDLFASPKARALFDYYIDATSLGYFLPSIGDSGGIQPPRRVPPLQYSYMKKENLFAFQRYNDPRYARALVAMNGKSAGGELFEPYPEDAINAALTRPEAKITSQSRLLDGYGIGILESGEGLQGRAVALNYSAIIGHRQNDNLNLEFFARGVDQLPDLGYPYGWAHRFQWDANSLAHNTVTVDETQPARSRGNLARLFGSANGVHVVTAQHDPYPQGYLPDTSAAKNVDLYERTVLLIDIDPEHFYVVDLFAVRGGEQHDQSWHGPLKPMQLPALDWKEQQSGTLAGPDVAPYTKWTDKWKRERDDFPSFLQNIRRARIEKPAALNWEMGLPEGDALRLHIVPVGGELEAIAGEGSSPARGKDWRLDYLVARRTVSPGTRSLFLSVLDAFQKTPTVQQTRLVSEKPLVLEVTRTGGVDTIHFNLPEGAGRGTTPRLLGVRVVSREGTKQTRDVRIGAQNDQSAGYVNGTIRSVDYSGNRIAIESDRKFDASFSMGRALRIYNNHRSALYRIHSARREGQLLWLQLDQTALLARGPVSKVGESQLTLNSHIVYAQGELDKTGKLKPDLDFFAGSHLGEGANALPVRGIVGGESSHVFFNTDVSPAQLQKDWMNKIVSIWQYGPGDKIELAIIESSRTQNK